jgi:hypothetical protein
MAFENELKNHLDSEGRLIRLPAKFQYQVMAIYRLAESFQFGRAYSETEVDAILQERHLFNDCCTLRRSLVDFRQLERTPDGRSYWLNPNRPNISFWGFHPKESKE